MSSDADLDEVPVDPQPPQDLDAERALLGAVLQSPTALNEALDVIQAEDFYLPKHGVIWEAITRIRAAGDPVDAIIVNRWLGNAGQITRAGGGPYLHTLINMVPTAVNVGYYIKIVIEQSRLRRLRQMGLRAVHLTETGARGADVDDVIAMVQRDVAVATADRGGASTRHAAEVSWAFLESLDQPVTGVVPTPWPELDDLMMGGLRTAEMTIVAGRPGTGKTAAGLNLTRRAAQAGVPSVFFSLEMGRDQLMARLVADVGAVELDRLVRHTLDAMEWDRAKRAVDRIAELPLWIDDSSVLSVERIDARCDRLPVGPGLVVVDYLALAEPADKRAPRQEQVAGLSRAFKRFAKDRGIPLVVLHQLNRGPESRATKRPMLADLRESGSLEQDADNVILLWRPEERPHEMQMLLAKQRQGPTGEISLRYEGRYTRVTSNW